MTLFDTVEHCLTLQSKIPLLPLGRPLWVGSHWPEESIVLSFEQGTYEDHKNIKNEADIFFISEPGHKIP